jgi:hypothetical protein
MFDTARLHSSNFIRLSRFGSCSRPLAIAILAQAIEGPCIACPAMLFSELDAAVVAAEASIQRLSMDIKEFLIKVRKCYKKEYNKLFRVRGGKRIQSARRKAAEQGIPPQRQKKLRRRCTLQSDTGIEYRAGRRGCIHEGTSRQLHRDTSIEHRASQTGLQNETSNEDRANSHGRSIHEGTLRHPHSDTSNEDYSSQEGHLKNKVPFTKKPCGIFNKTPASKTMTARTAPASKAMTARSQNNRPANDLGSQSPEKVQDAEEGVACRGRCPFCFEHDGSYSECALDFGHEGRCICFRCYYDLWPSDHRVTSFFAQQ